MAVVKCMEVLVKIDSVQGILLQQVLGNLLIINSTGISNLPQDKTLA